MGILDRIVAAFAGGSRESYADRQLEGSRDQVDALTKRLSMVERAAELDRVTIQPWQEAHGVAHGRRQQLPPETYVWHVWAYACAFRVAQAVAMVRLRGVRGSGDETALPRDIERPNVAMSRTEHIEHLVLDLLLSGDCYEYLAKDGLWRVDPRRMKVVPDREKRIRAWEYDAGIGKSITLDPRLVIHRRFPNPVDDWYGLGPGGVALDDIKLDEEMRRFNRSFFENGARLSLILETDAELTKARRKQLWREFTHEFAGAANHFKVGIASHGLKLREGGETHSDMEFAVGQDKVRDRVVAAFGVPPVMVGIYNEANFANAREQKAIFYEQTVIPICRRLTQGWNDSPVLTPNPDRLRVEFDESELHAKVVDLGIAATAAATLYSAGLYGRDRIRERFFFDAPMGPEEEADVKPAPPPSPFGFGAPPPPSPRPPPSREPMDEGGDDEGTEERSLAKAADQAAAWKPAPGWASKAWGELVTRAQDEAAPTFRDDVVRPLFRRQRTKLLAIFGAEKAGPSDPDDALREVLEALDDDVEGWAEASEPAMRREVERLGRETLLGLGLDPDTFNINDPRVAEWLRTRSFTFAQDVIETTKGTIRGVIAEAVDEGATLSDIAGRIKDTYDDWDGTDGELDETRAMRIARTETVAAQNVGVLEAFSQSEIVEGKTWMTLGDGAVRASHAALDGQTVGLESSFSNGLKHPGDMSSGAASETVNCRCTIQPAVRA